MLLFLPNRFVLQIEIDSNKNWQEIFSLTSISCTKGKQPNHGRSLILLNVSKIPKGLFTYLSTIFSTCFYPITKLITHHHSNITPHLNYITISFHTYKKITLLYIFPRTVQIGWRSSWRHLIKPHLIKPRLIGWRLQPITNGEWYNMIWYIKQRIRGIFFFIFIKIKYFYINVCKHVLCFDLFLL